ncbi:MAG: hypothetical protein J6C67_00710 [Muribaculaceae bacterium]|nr:hypothetical protein [Muribaculaceae bacterium]
MLRFILCSLAAACTLAAVARETIDYSVSLLANASSGTFAPYMLGSWNSGRITEGKGIWHDGFAHRDMEMDRRLSWEYGVEYMLGYGSAANYEYYEPATSTFESAKVRQSPARLIQLYAALKYRSVFILGGMKEQPSLIVDGRLSSGDLVRSNNARPIPGVTIGFIRFVDIPFTNGWVQINGEIMYGRMTDDGFDNRQFNYYQGVLANDLCYTYKRCYFRTKPSQPFSVTVGMQTAGMFGGKSLTYRHGELISTENRGFHVRDLWDMFFPHEGSGENYYKGNSLGSWDFHARYRFASGTTVAAYFEWPFEDGSGIGKQNGWDGLWGLQLTLPQGNILESVVFEYLDFTNQSGYVHFSHTDAPGTTIEGHATGGDDYYNNNFYGPYANYGMSIGTPFLRSPRYNLDGYPGYLHNRARGFHAAALGNIADEWSWRAMISYQKAGGSGRQPAYHKLHDTSAMLEAAWTPATVVPGLSVKCSLAFDRGNLRGNNFGGMLSLSYSGNFAF